MKKMAFVIFIFPLSVIFYCLLSIYFQQDEWHSFGVIQSYGLRYIMLDKSLLQLLFTDRVGSRAITFFLFKIFGPSGAAFGIFAATIHLLNTYLVFLFAHRLTKRVTLALITTLFFLVNPLGYQAYSWFGTMAGSATSLTFILLSILAFLKFIDSRRFIWIITSTILIWISFLFKESAYFLFLLYPLIWILATPRKTIQNFLLQNSLIIVYGAIMTFLLAYSILTISGSRANYVATNNSGFLKLLFHLASYPTEGFVQVFLPPQIIFQAAYQLTSIFTHLTPDTSQFDVFYSTVMAEGVTVAVLLIFAIFLFYFFKKHIVSSNQNLKFVFKFSILFLLLSFLPYIVLDKFDAYLDSRYYYVSTVGASLFLGILATEFAKLSRARRRELVICIFGAIGLYYFLTLTNALYQETQIAAERKNIIHQIITIAPKLDNRTVFFVTGNSPGFYGIPELKVPFQSGLGQVLMVVYGTRRQISPEIFKEETLAKSLDVGFLYDTLSQGFKEVNGQGFGYFYDIQTLKEAIGRKQFSKENVISLFYDSNYKTVHKVSIQDFPRL